MISAQQKQGKVAACIQYGDCLKHLLRGHIQENGDVFDGFLSGRNDFLQLFAGSRA